MEKIIREYKIPEHLSRKYIFGNNLDLLKLYTADDFQSSIQDHIFVVDNKTAIEFSMSPTYIISLNFLNAYDLFIYIQQIKSTEFEYISNMFLDAEQKIELSDDLFYRWLYKNDDFTRSVFCSSLENFYRLTEYFITYKSDYYNDYIKETYDEKKIRWWFGVYTKEDRHNEEDDQNLNDDNYLEFVDGIENYLKKNLHKFYVNKIDINEYEIISEENESYTFGILDAYTFYITSEISGLIKLTRFNIIELSTSELEKLRKLYFKYKHTYNYKLYVLDCIIYREIKYIPEGTKIITDSDIETIEDSETPLDSTQDLSEFIDVLNYIISLENKISVDDFYNSFGYRGFEIFNHIYNYHIFDYSDQDNDLWYECYKILHEGSRDIFFCNLAGIEYT